MIKMKLKKLAKKLFEGEITVRKTELWLIGAVCMLVGIVHGLLAAPLTHGIMIGNNSNNTNSLNGDDVIDGSDENQDE